MITLSLPQPVQLVRYLEIQSRLPFTYQQTGHTKLAKPARRYNNDYLKVQIGQGDADFRQAQEAIRRWRMFPGTWTRVLPQNAPIREGTTVAVYIRSLGLWWRNASRIIYTVEEPNCFGFAYGTLPGHIEKGEELFLVEIQPDGAVYYEIRAFSLPRHWLAWLGYPLARYLQAVFRRDSAKQMQAFIQQA
jgi:uncharacterized protein (UPF0548 family)